MDRAASAGIDATYSDTWGTQHVVPPATLERFVELFERHVAEKNPVLEPVHVWRDGEPQPLGVTLEAPQAFICTREDGSREEGTLSPADAGERNGLALPFLLPLGYHRLELAGAVSTLIVVPAHCFLSDPCADGGRVWGISLQLYALRSRRNWGIGDFTDLREVIRIAREAGAASVGLNPLHALHVDNPEAASPYSPTSRLFLNPLYIDVEALGGVSESSEIQSVLREPAFGKELERLRALDHVGYTGVAAVKQRIFGLAYEAFRERELAASWPSPQAVAFRDWLREGGTTLEDFATYEALREHFAHEHPGGWTAWPSELHDPRGDAVARFRNERRERIEYHAWLQWHADAQFAACCQAASSMGVGVYRDLAVGADLTSADVWLDRGSYVIDTSVGAPPDELNRQGQDWGLPPIDPFALRERGYAAFAQLLRANMRGAGALRIDHAMSLMRLFWIPRGSSPRTGTYIHYPFEEMLGILALESTRARCMVIGEDLGTVPAGFRERMEDARVLSYRLLFFEREWSGAFRTPERYPVLALVTAGTHDLATLGGYASSRDIDLRASLRLTRSPDDPGADYHDREGERRALFDLLVASGALAEETAAALPERSDGEARTGAYEPLVLAAYRFLARTPGCFEMIPLDDILGELDQINLPGTWNEYPNWRRKLGCEIERLSGDNRLSSIAEMLRAEGRSS